MSRPRPVLLAQPIDGGRPCGSCDTCGAFRPLHYVGLVFGTETWCCTECHPVEWDEDVPPEFNDEIPY